MGPILIQRFLQNEQVTLGTLVIMGMPALITMEPPWRGNEHNVSCIPTGEYDADLIETPRWGHTLLLKDVPDRSGILIHPLNYVKQTKGCIGVGKVYSYQDQIYSIHGSLAAFKALQTQLESSGETRFNLEIRHVWEA